MFTKDKRTGELAEKKAYAFLKKAGYEPELPREQQKDHDIILGDGRKVEVKFDVVMDTTRNLGVEWWSNKIERKEGWGQYCEADILIQFHNMDNAVVVDWWKFKEWLNENMDQFERKDSQYSNADVILVPMEQIPDRVKEPEIGNLFALDYGLENWEIDLLHGKTYKIEPSKSGRSVCRACGEKIQKHELRIKDSGKWLHLNCAASEFIVTESSLDRLTGFDELTEWQTEHAKKIVKRKKDAL
jgi:hypothetical protein